LGVFVSPVLAGAYVVADRRAGDGRRAAAGAWVNTAFNAGSTAGAALAGVGAGVLSPGACFALAALPVLAGAAGAVRSGTRARARAARAGAARARAAQAG
ncbi:MFS transporter, partial [Kitasatospora sp. NPDC058965]